MGEQLWNGLAGQLQARLAEEFPATAFTVDPLAAHGSATLDVSWTDGPPLHEVDAVSQRFVLGLDVDTWTTGGRHRLEKVGKRRTMSPEAERILLDALKSELDIVDGEPDRTYPLPGCLRAPGRSTARAETGELLDLLFESVSFAAGQRAELTMARCCCPHCGPGPAM